ncbi:MAG TPA: hypothetical protein GYA04_02365 [Acholeplasma sp.]|nr:hypothetical protein [Acholeplasma sp.]
MKHYLIHDTLEAFLKNGDDLYFFGMTTNGNINKTVNQEFIRAGIGNKIAAVVQTENTMEFTITTGLHYHEIYEIQSGEKFSKSSEIQIQDVTIGSDGTVVATNKTVAGDVIEFKADSYPKVHSVQLRTIVYDPDTNEVVGDLYFIFDKGLPNGALNEAFEAGNKTAEISFTALADEDGNYGKCVFVPKQD